MISPAKHKVVKHLVRECDTLTSDYYGAVAPFPEKVRKNPGNAGFFR